MTKVDSLDNSSSEIMDLTPSVSKVRVWAKYEEDQLPLDISFLQHRTYFSWHHSPFFRRILALKIVRHLLESHPFNAFMLVNMIDDSFPH